MILEFEHDMESICSISTDINDLVSEQGEQISLMEDNIALTKIRTEQAEKDLVKAAEYQSSSRYSMVILIVAVTTMVNVPLGLAFGVKVGLIGAGCCVGVGAGKMIKDS
jgi:syntaxin 7